MSTGSRDGKDQDGNNKANDGANQPSSSKSPSPARHPEANSSAEDSRRTEQTQALDLRKKNNNSSVPSSTSTALLPPPSAPISPSVRPNAAAPDFKHCEWCKKPIRPGLCGNSNFCRDICFESYRRCHYKKRTCCAICGQRGDWDAGDSVNGSLEELPERVCTFCQHFQNTRRAMESGNGRHNGQPSSSSSVGSPVPSTSGSIMTGRAGARSNTSASAPPPPTSISAGQLGRSMIQLTSAPTQSLEHLAQIQHIQNLPFEFRTGTTHNIHNFHHAPSMQSVSDANTMSLPGSPSIATSQHAARSHDAPGLARIQHANLHSNSMSHAIPTRIQTTGGRAVRLPPHTSAFHHRPYPPTTAQSCSSPGHTWFMGNNSCPMDPIPNLVSPIHSPRQKGTAYRVDRPPEIHYRPQVPSPDDRYHPTTPSPDSRYCMGTPPSEIHYHPKESPESPYYVVTPCRTPSSCSTTTNNVSATTSQGHQSLSPMQSGLQPRLPPPRTDERDVVVNNPFALSPHDNNDYPLKPQVLHAYDTQSQGPKPPPPPPPPPPTPNYNLPLSVQIPRSSGEPYPMASPEQHQLPKRPRMDGGMGSRPNNAMFHHIPGRGFGPNPFYTQGMSIQPWHNPGVGSGNPYSPKSSCNGIISSGSSSVGSSEILPSPPDSRVLDIGRLRLPQESIPTRPPLPMAPPVTGANFNNFSGIFSQLASVKQEYGPIEGMGSVTRGGRGRGKCGTKGRGRGRGAANNDRTTNECCGKQAVATVEMGTSVTEDLGLQPPNTRSVGTSTHADASTNTSLLPPSIPSQVGPDNSFPYKILTGRSSSAYRMSASAAAGSSSAIAGELVSGENSNNENREKKQKLKKKGEENGNDEKTKKGKKDSKTKKGKQKTKKMEKSDQERASRENAAGSQRSSGENGQCRNIHTDIYIFTDESEDIGAQVEISTADDSVLPNEDGIEQQNQDVVANANDQNDEEMLVVNAQEATREFKQPAPKQRED